MSPTSIRSLCQLSTSFKRSRCVCVSSIDSSIGDLTFCPSVLNTRRLPRVGSRNPTPLACFSGGRAGAAGDGQSFRQARHFKPKLNGAAWLYRGNRWRPRPHAASYVTPAAPTSAATRAPATAVRGPKQRRRSCLWWCWSWGGWYGRSSWGGESATTSTGEF